MVGPLLPQLIVGLPIANLLALDLPVLDILDIQGGLFFWPPPNLTKSQALYKLNWPPPKFPKSKNL